LHKNRINHKENEMAATKTVVTSLVIGTAIGLAIGFLCAPRPGKETREMLMKRMKHGKQQTAEFVTTA
jgi:gas vesicle protein